MKGRHCGEVIVISYIIVSDIKQSSVIKDNSRLSCDFEPVINRPASNATKFMNRRGRCPIQNLVNAGSTSYNISLFELKINNLTKVRVVNVGFINMKGVYSICNLIFVVHA